MYLTGKKTSDMEGFAPGGFSGKKRVRPRVLGGKLESCSPSSAKVWGLLILRETWTGSRCGSKGWFSSRWICFVMRIIVVS